MHQARAGHAASLTRPVVFFTDFIKRHLSIQAAAVLGALSKALDTLACHYCSSADRRPLLLYACRSLLQVPLAT